MRPRPALALQRSSPALILTLLLLTIGASLPAGAQGPAPAAAGDHLITSISLDGDSPNIIPDGQDVNLSFSYSTTDTGGVRIFARPFSDGALTPNYAAHGSPLYPQSASGTASGSFTITSGQVVVDQIRLQMYNADQSALLFEGFIPVYYLFSDAANIVTALNFTPDTPDVLPLGADLNASFSYSTQGAGSVRIFLRPFTNGALTPSYAAHGSPAYPTGSGSGSGSFTITTGQAVVDQVRVQMWNEAQTALLFEAFLPVYFRFRVPSNIVTNIELGPDTPNIFSYSQDVGLTFDYSTSEPGGVRIFARPFSGANLSPNYAAHGSPLYPAGSGRGSGSFRITSGPLTVDKIRIQMWNEAQTTLLYEAFLPVSLHWAGAGPPPGPDMAVNAIEVTQAIQDLNNSVDLVAGKRTYVRVHVSSPVNTADVFATLSGRRGFLSLTPVLSPGNPGGDITVRTGPNREQLNDSFWFELPSGWTAAGNLTLTARLDPINAKNDLAQSNNLRSVTVNFKSTPPLQLRLVNVRYTASGSTHSASNSDMSQLESWLRRAYPISSLQVTRDTLTYPSSGLPNVNTLNGLLAVSKILRILLNGEDSRVVYYGFVDDGGGFMRGKAAGIPGTIASGPTGPGDFGWDFDGSYGDWYGGHEIGHTRGRSHAEFCGAADGASYPYPGGRISPSLSGSDAVYGFDIATRAIYGPSWKDVMTYCANEWISDFTYEGIRSHLVSVGPASLAQSASGERFLMVTGSADLALPSATLDQVALIDQSATAPLPEPGGWAIVLVDAANNDLASYAFEPDVLSDGETIGGTPALIAEVVPWAEGAVKVEIRRDGQLLASRSASANAPSVSVTAPAAGSAIAGGPFQASWAGSDPDGDPLSYSLLISNDGGASWQPLAAGLTATSLELNSDQLAGGPAMLRVVASDGFLSGQADSGAFTLPLHPPGAEILQPAAGQVFFPTQQVTLQASGYDLEDGALGDGAFAWSSSIDGALGGGATLSTSELSTGSHTITVTVTDSDGQSSQATRTISVAEAGAPEAVTLAVAPFAVGVTLPFKGAAVQQQLSVNSSSEEEISWSASEEIPWLTLAQSSGQTPAEFVATITPDALAVGTHTGTIVFSSSQPGVSPVSVPVTVQVTGHSLFIPMARR